MWTAIASGAVLVLIMGVGGYLLYRRGLSTARSEQTEANEVRLEKHVEAEQKVPTKKDALADFIEKHKGDL